MENEINQTPGYEFEESYYGPLSEDDKKNLDHLKSIAEEGPKKKKESIKPEIGLVEAVHNWFDEIRKEWLKAINS